MHDIDEHESRHFIAMEYLEGKALKHRIQGKSLATHDPRFVQTSIKYMARPSYLLKR